MANQKPTYNPDSAIHPGISLRDELEFLGISQSELSLRTGLSEKHISQIINGEGPISPETSIKLERTLGVPASFWNNLQKNFELHLARLNAEKQVAEEISEARKFGCYDELAALGCIEATKDWTQRTNNLLKFFGVDSLSYVKTTEAIAFRQTQGRFDELSLAAWLRCGEIDAGKLTISEFDKKLVKEIIPHVRRLTLNPEGFGDKLVELCRSVGIAVVYTPYFKRTRVNGSARWIGNRPVIQLNTRGAYSDIFWFTFFHELGHILLHGIKDKFLEYDGREKDEKEREADRFAEDALIPPAEYKKLLAARPLNRIAVEEFAQGIGIDKSIVFGRLAHEGKARWQQIANLRDRLVIRP